MKEQGNSETVAGDLNETTTVTCQEHLVLKETRHKDSGNLWKSVRQVLCTLGPIMFQKITVESNSVGNLGVRLPSSEIGLQRELSISIWE